MFFQRRAVLQQTIFVQIPVNVKNVIYIRWIKNNFKVTYYCKKENANVLNLFVTCFYC